MTSAPQRRTAPHTAASHTAAAQTTYEKVSRISFLVLGLAASLGILLSFVIGWGKDSDLPLGSGYRHVFSAGWPNLLNQPAFFTFLSTALVAVTSLMLAAKLHRTSEIFRALRLCGVICMTITGVVFNVLLREEVPLPPLEHANDVLQHIVLPVAAPLLWLVFGPRRHAKPALVFVSSFVPLCWLAFTLARGLLMDWYPYTILDVPRLGYDGIGIYVVSILGSYYLIGLLMSGLDRLMPAPRSELRHTGRMSSSG